MSEGRCPCPLCGKLLVHGGRHFTTVHGMTAAEVRALTGKPTIDPVIAKMIGIEIDERTGRRRWRDAEILGAIRHAYQKSGNAPAQWTKATKTHPSAIVVYARFGSWTAALDAAGVPRRRPQYRTSPAQRVLLKHPRSPRVTKVCPACDEPFEVTPYRAPLRETCSRACKASLRTQRSRVTKTCLACSEAFELLPSQGRETCSRACTTALRRQRRLGALVERPT